MNILLECWSIQSNGQLIQTSEPMAYVLASWKFEICWLCESVKNMEGGDRQKGVNLVKFPMSEAENIGPDPSIYYSEYELGEPVLENISW